MDNLFCLALGLNAMEKFGKNAFVKHRSHKQTQCHPTSLTPPSSKVHPLSLNFKQLSSHITHLVLVRKSPDSCSHLGSKDQQEEEEELWK